MAQAIGGQAVLEGVMMRGPRNWAVAVRKPDGAIAHVARSIAEELLRSPEGLRAVGLPESERFVSLLHLGHPRQEKEPPERPPIEQSTEFLA